VRAQSHVSYRRRFFCAARISRFRKNASILNFDTRACARAHPDCDRRGGGLLTRGNVVIISILSCLRRVRGGRDARHAHTRVRNPRYHRDYSRAQSSESILGNFRANRAFARKEKKRKGTPLHGDSLTRHRAYFRRCKTSVPCLVASVRC